MKKSYLNTTYKKQLITILIILMPSILLLNSFSEMQVDNIDISTPHNQGVRFTSFLDNLSNMITLGYEGTIIKWDISKKTSINSVKLTKTNITSTSITEDKQTLCLGFSDGFVSFIKLDDLSVIKSFKLPKGDAAISVSLSFDKNYFVVINADNTLSLYSFDKGKLLKIISNKSFTGYIPKMNLKNRLIIFYKSNEIIIYSLHSYSIIKHIILDKKEIIYDVKLSEDGKNLYISGEKGNIYSLSIGLNYKLKTLHQAEDKKWIMFFSIDRYGNIVYVTEDNLIYFFNPNKKISYQLFKSKKDITNLDTERYGRYFLFSDMFDIHIIRIDKW